MRRTRIVVVIAALLAFSLSAGAGAAFAYFSSTGSGSGSASVGSMKSVTVAATVGTPTSALLPGGAADVVFSVTNPNGFAVSLVSVTLKTGGMITPDSGHAGCTTTDSKPTVTLSVPSPDLPVTVPANTTTQVDLAAAATMDIAATSSCQGASFSVPITISVQS
jgi:hypothetical protein